MNTRKQGDIGVAAGIFYYTSLGYGVSVPLTDTTRYDLIVDDGQRLLRIQCKTTRHRTPQGSYEVTLQTSGGNRSGNGKVAKISVAECDAVFVYRMDGVRYHFPVEYVAGKTMLNLGPKQDEYKV